MQGRRCLTCIFSSLVIAVICCNPARADVTGSILGVVRDSTQAVVPWAPVVATNVATNVRQETKAASDGTYRFLALPAGTYRLTATAAGFQESTTTGIDLTVNAQLRIDVTLQVGSVRQEMTVAANAVQVESESTQLSDVIESKKMLALPLNGRSYVDLLGLQAGVAPAASHTIGGDRLVSGTLSAGNVSVNGHREAANAFLVNGGDVSEGRNMGAGLIPNLDSIEEFRLITNSFSAEYGKFSGDLMNAITKSGTNGFHGDGFEFLRNDTLDARNFFATSKSVLRRNQFGYAIGGPFWKNKLFWFTDYQGTRQSQGAGTGIVQVIPSAQRQGNFDPSTLTGTVDGAYWAQVLTQRLGYGVTNGERYSFAGCTVDCVFPGGVIPQLAWSTASTGTLPYVPLGNVDPTTGIYSDNSQKNRVRDDKAAQRVDFFNQKTGSWSWYYHFDGSSVFNALPSASVAGFPVYPPGRAQQIVMSNTKNLGPSAVNEARVSFFRPPTVMAQPQGSFASLSSLGFVTGLGTLGINPSGGSGFPQYVPQLSFANLSIGVPSLTTTQIGRAHV